MDMKRLRRRHVVSLIGGATRSRRLGPRVRPGRAGQARPDRRQSFRRVDGQRHAQGVLQRLREEVRHPCRRDEPGGFRQAPRHGRFGQCRMGPDRDRRPGCHPCGQAQSPGEGRRQGRRSLEVSRRRRATPMSSPRRSTPRSSAIAPTCSKAARSPRAGPTGGTSRNSPAPARCATIRPTTWSSR